MRSKLVSFAQTALGVNIRPDDIAAIHPLPVRSGSSAGAPRPVLVRFATNDAKTAVMRARKKLRAMPRDSPIYINDQMTQHYADLFRKCRDLKKENKIDSTWTINGYIRVKTNDMRIRYIKSISDLADLQVMFRS